LSLLFPLRPPSPETKIPQDAVRERVALSTQELSMLFFAVRSWLVQSSVEPAGSEEFLVSAPAPNKSQTRSLVRTIGFSGTLKLVIRKLKVRFRVEPTFHSLTLLEPSRARYSRQLDSRRVRFENSIDVDSIRFSPTSD